MSKVEERLKAIGIELPQPVAPVANYVTFVKTGALVHISGQISLDADGGVKGTVGVDVDLETAQKAAKDAYEESPGATHTPLLIFLDRDNETRTVVITTLQDKDFTCAALRALLRDKHATCYLFVSEAWLSMPRHVPDDWKNMLAPSLDPERKEAIIIYARYPSGRKSLSLGMIDDGVVEPLVVKADSADGTWEGDDRFGTLMDEPA